MAMSEYYWWHVSEGRFAYRNQRETKLECILLDKARAGHYPARASFATMTMEPLFH